MYTWYVSDCSYSFHLIPVTGFVFMSPVVWSSWHQMGTQVVCLITSLQLKSVHKRVSLVFCSGEAMTHIRYVCRHLDATQVLEALSSAGLLAVIQPGKHKAMQPEQSHWRWQVSAQCFTVHPGYSKWSKHTPDILIVQGRRGWTEAILKRPKDAITAAPEGIQHIENVGLGQLWYCLWVG